MPRYSYERLSAQDTSFLVFESANAFTHGAGTAIYDAGPLATPGGGIDMPTLRRSIEALLHQVPRFRQRLQWIPVEQHPCGWTIRLSISTTTCVTLAFLSLAPSRS